MAEDQSTNEVICLRVAGEDNSLVNIKIKRNETLGSLMRDYCMQTGQTPAQTRFYFHGNEIHWYDTPSSLNIQQNNIIEVTRNAVDSDVIHLMILTANLPSKMYKVKRHSSLVQLITDYCRRNNLIRQHIQFFFSGKLIHDIDTPVSLKIKNNDKIHVVKSINYPDLDSINLKFKYNGRIENFKTEYKFALEMVMRLFCDRLELTYPTNVRFFYNNTEINGAETPESLQMVGGDEIKLGSKVRGKLLDNVPTSKSINIKTYTGGLIQNFKIPCDARMKKLIDCYCKHMDISSAHYFRFRYLGETFDDNDTPDSLGMQDGDTIDVYERMFGG